MDKLIQTMSLVPVKVSSIRVQIDVVVSAVPVVIEGPYRSLYASVATQTLLKVAVPAPVSLLPIATRARALVVHWVFCRQLVADILWKVRRLRLGTSERV